MPSKSTTRWAWLKGKSIVSCVAPWRVSATSFLGLARRTETSTMATMVVAAIPNLYQGFRGKAGGLITTTRQAGDDDSAE